MFEEQPLYSLHEVVERLPNKTEIARAAALLRHLQDGRLKSVVALRGLTGGEVVEVGSDCWKNIPLDKLVGSGGAVRPSFALKADIALLEERAILRRLISAIGMHSDLLLDELHGPPDQNSPLGPVPSPKPLSLAAQTLLFSRGVHLPTNPALKDLRSAAAHCERRLRALVHTKQPLQALVRGQVLHAFIRGVRSRTGKDPKPRGRIPRELWPEIYKLAIDRSPFSDDQRMAIARSIVKKLADRKPPGDRYIAGKLKPLVDISPEKAREKMHKLLRSKTTAKS